MEEYAREAKQIKNQISIARGVVNGLIDAIIDKYCMDDCEICPLSVYCLGPEEGVMYNRDN